MATDRLFNQTQGDNLIAAVTALQNRGFSAAQITTLLSTLSGTNSALDAIRAAIASTSRGSVVSVTPAQSGGQAVGTVRVDNVDFPLYSLPTVARVQTALSSVADILAAQDAEKTATGNPVTITAKAAPVRDLSVQIDAVQSGTGDPSPTNIRPITGWTAVTVTRTGGDGANPVSVTVSLGDAGTVYGGTLDMLTGTLTVTHVSKTISGGTRMYRIYGAYTRYVTSLMDDGVATQQNVLVSNAVAWDNGTSNAPLKYLFGSGAERFSLFLLTELGDGNTFFSNHPVQVVYALESPVTYSLTPAQLSTLAGTNVVSADCGPGTVRFMADISGDIADLRAKINAIGGA